MTARTVTTTTTTAGGDGYAPTARELREALSGVPDDARVTVSSHSDQREGASWTLEAKWQSAPRPNTPVLRSAKCSQCGHLMEEHTETSFGCAITGCPCSLIPGDASLTVRQGHP